MTRTAAQRVTRVWGLLVLFTFLGLAASRSGLAGLAANGLILGAAVAKGRWMLLDFLALRRTTPGWRHLMLSWLLIVVAVAWAASAVPLLRH